MEKGNKKTKKIFRKIFWPIVHILILFAIVTFVFNYLSIDKFVKNNAKEKIAEAYEEVEIQINEFANSGETEFKLKSTEKLINQSNNTKVYVYDDNFNEVALFDNTINIDKEMTVFLSDLLQNFELDENVLTTILFKGREYLANTYVASSSLKIKEKYFVVVQDMTDKAMLLKESSKTMLFAEVLILLIVLLTVFLIARDLAKPIIKLSKESENYVIGRGATIDDKVISTKELESLRVALKEMQIKIDEEANRKNTIYENVAHDLRTPLVSILGYADGLKSGIIKDKNIACDVILRTGNQLKEMIENILVLSRFDNETYKGNKEEINLVDLILEQIEMVKVLDDNIKVEFVNNLKNDDILISDRKLIIRIIQNLLSNAIKYASSVVTIMIKESIEEDFNQDLKTNENNLDENFNIKGENLNLEKIKTQNSHFVISISDDGTGIENKYIHSIFTRYYKGSDGHFGIGLAVVKSSIDYLGGTISVKSIEGSGTTFTISL